MTRVDFYGLLLAAVGFVLLYWARCRVLYRGRTPGGEVWPCGSGALQATLADGVLVGVAVGMIGSAVVILVLEHAASWLGLAMILYVVYLFERNRYRRRRG